MTESAQVTQEGHTSEQSGNAAEALRLYDAALQKDGKNVAAVFLKAELLSRSNRSQEARGCYAELHRLLPTGPDVSLHAGMMHAQALLGIGQREEALQWFDRALALEPKQGELWEMKGNVLVELGRHEEALQTFEAAKRMAHDDPTRIHLEASYCRGVVLRRQGSNREAVSHLDVVTRMKPDHTDAWYQKGLALNTLRQYREAFAAQERVTALAPEHALGWLNKGIVLLNLGRDLEGAMCFRRAIHLNPGLADKLTPEDLKLVAGIGW